MSASTVLFRRTPVPLLPGTFSICVADTVEEAAAFACKHHLKKVVEVPDTCTAGLLRSGGSKFALVCGRPDLSHGIIAHELYHGTARILDYANVTADHGNAETGAYLCEWLTKWTYRVLTKAGETIKP